MSVDTATQGPTALQGDTRRDKKKTARIRENSQLPGRFPRVWQVLGSNQRRLSRRFYSPLAPPESPRADQRIRRSRCVCGPPPSAIRPWVPGFGVRAVHGRARTSPRTGAEKATDRAGGSGYADRSHSDSRSDLPFQDACSVSPSPSSPGSPRRLLCRGPRQCAGWRRWPGRRCSGRRSSAGPRRRARRGGRPRRRAPGVQPHTRVGVSSARDAPRPARYRRRACRVDRSATDAIRVSSWAHPSSQ